jgi:hypothetical protein
MSWRCDLFVRSYWRDLDWLELCLRSIDRNCSGFGRVIVVVPDSSRAWLRRTPLASDERIVFCRDYVDDYLGQQVTKLFADTYSDADYICHVDSDCVFIRPVSPADLFLDGRPAIVRTPYSALGRHHPWRRPTETFLGWPVEDDFMRRPPFVYPRTLYSEVRAHCLSTHGVDVETYVTTRPPRCFSEFNVLGAFAWRHRRESFTWVDAASTASGGDVCRWYWSWARVDESVRREIASLLGGASA